MLPSIHAHQAPPSNKGPEGMEGARECRRLSAKALHPAMQRGTAQEDEL